MSRTFESEVKLACDDLDRLSRAGFELRVVESRHFEDNWLLDLPRRKLFRQGEALRVRSVNGKGWITYKGAVRQDQSPVKVREEIEFETDAPERAVELFARLGYHRSFRYQKYRTVYETVVDDQRLHVVLDETPMGNFIEIEGNEAAIVRVLEAAGFSAKDAVRQSYPELQASRCRERGVPIEDLVFE
jgi:adenylate cyclase class 2